MFSLRAEKNDCQKCEFVYCLRDLSQNEYRNSYKKFCVDVFLFICAKWSGVISEMYCLHFLETIVLFEMNIFFLSIALGLFCAKPIWGISHSFCLGYVTGSNSGNNLELYNQN
jgi:hypothetical protein